jgi:hypothetical protein
VSGHKFRMGQTVIYSVPFGHGASIVCEVTQLLPVDDNEFQYRIKSVNEPHQRVAKESQLTSRQSD